MPVIEQRLLLLERDVAALEPLALELNTLQGTINGLVVDVSDLGTTLKARDDRASAERASLRLALLTLTGVLGTPIVGGLVTFLLTKA